MLLQMEEDGYKQVNFPLKNMNSQFTTRPSDGILVIPRHVYMFASPSEVWMECAGAVCRFQSDVFATYGG